MSPRPGVVTIGVSVHDTYLTPDVSMRRRILALAADAGIEQVVTGDHISFHDGTGFDGMLSATSILSTEERVKVLIGVYLLGLRHPMLAARQLATLSQLAPGRLILGVGVGGEDRAEIANAGVDPRTRGRRLDESLAVMRKLLRGESVTHRGEFFDLSEAKILPAPMPAVPLIIGGSGDVAIRRVVNHGDGWLAIFSTARRFAETVAQIRERTAHRDAPPKWFGLSTWAGFDDSQVTARARLDRRLEDLYNTPGEKFHHLTPAGPPQAVAEYLAPYVETGAHNITIVPAAASIEAGIENAAEVQRILNGS